MSDAASPKAAHLVEAKPLTFVDHVVNIFHLVIKELRSIRADPTMLILVVYAFSISVNTVATGAVTEATNLSVGIVDEDGSDPSHQIAEGLRLPTFQPPVQITASDLDPMMDQGKLLFVVEIPPNFEADIRAQRQTGLQINVDATAVAQAGNGAGSLSTAIANEIQKFISGSGGSAVDPINLVVRAAFNPNLKTAWFSAMTQVINQITLLTVILNGAALIREREQGTVEHLLVMPVVPSEIMLAKMIANGLVILVAAMLSLQFVVHWWIGSPINGSLLLFLFGAAIYALVVAALGIMLGTLATTMGQFGLLAMPVLIVTQLLSGSATPMESMPVFCQTRRVLTNLEAWIRRRLRLYLWRQWRTGQNRFKELCHRGISKFNAAVAAGSPTGLWRMSGHPSVQQALRNSYFDSLGLPRIYVPAQA